MAVSLSSRHIRILMLGTFLLISGGFGILFFAASRNEIRDGHRFMADAGDFQRKIFVCRQTLSDASAAVQNLLYDPNPVLGADVDARMRDLRQAVREFQTVVENPEFKDMSGDTEELYHSVRRIQTAILSFNSEIEEPEPLRSSEYRGSMQVMIGSLASASASLDRISYAAAVRLSARQNHFSAYFVRMQTLMALFFLSSILLSLAVSFLIERIIHRALISLSAGTRELRAGNLDYRFREVTPDEVGQVKYDINLMARKIQQQSNDLRRANQELRLQAEKLIEAHQHKDRFLSNMSHELRTPLNSIIGFSELINERAMRLPPEKMKSYSTRILTAAEHLLSLITSLLDLAKSGAGTLKPVFGDFDLSFAIQEMLDMLKPLADKKGLYLKSELEPELHLYADQRMIKQIFINLLSNAVKYTMAGGVTVKLYTESEPPHRILLDVADTGIGIPEQEHDNLFKDFHRVDNGPRFVVDGVGIGLALSRRLAAMNHGAISFTSVHGKGSVFTLSLTPVKPPPEPETPPEKPV